MITKITSSVNYIKFWYPKTEILSDVSMETEIRASKIVTKEGIPMIEQYTLTVNENDFFNIIIKEAIYEIGRRVVNLTWGLIDAVFDNDGSGNVGFMILDKKYYNENWLIIVDKDFKEALKFYVLLKWFERCGLEDMQLLQNEYVSIARQLTDDIYELRRPRYEVDVNITNPLDYPKTEIITPVNILANAEMNITHNMGVDTYIVTAIREDGRSIANFDAMITERGLYNIKFTSLKAYNNVTLIFVGVSSANSNPSTKVLLLENIDILVGDTQVPHNFGSDNYIVEGIKNDNTSIADFDSLITSRTSTGFVVHSQVEFLQTKLLLIGQ